MENKIIDLSSKKLALMPKVYQDIISYVHICENSGNIDLFSQALSRLFKAGYLQELFSIYKRIDGHSEALDNEAFEFCKVFFKKNENCKDNLSLEKDIEKQCTYENSEGSGGRRAEIDNFILRNSIEKGEFTTKDLVAYSSNMAALDNKVDVIRVLLKNLDLVTGNYKLIALFYDAAGTLKDTALQNHICRYNGLNLECDVDKKFLDTSYPSPPQKRGNAKIAKLLSLLLRRKQLQKRQPRVAICVSGIFRNGDVASKGLVKNLIEPLNADVFVHTWNVEDSWPGRTGGVNMVRIFGPRRAEILPLELRNINKFNSAFKNVASKLAERKYIDFSKNRLQDLLPVKKAVIESEEAFFKSIKDKGVEKSGLLSHQGNYNQAKQFYKMHECFQLMLEHEREANIKYDYVVRVRPDYLIRDKVTMRSLKRASGNRLLIDRFYSTRPSDNLAISNRKTMGKYFSVWPAMLQSEKLSPFTEYRSALGHDLLFLWFLKNNIYAQVEPIRTSLNASLKGSVPDISQEALMDLEESASKYKGQEWVAKFFELGGRENVEE